METLVVLRRFVDLLDSVADGAVSGPDALKSWGDPNNLPRVGTVSRGWEALIHYAEDDDIRERDRAYADAQVRELRVAAQKIRKKYGLT